VKILDRRQWEELKFQLLLTYAEVGSEGMKSEHLKLIYMLNRFGYNPRSDEDAVILAEELLQIGWE
jgi:hypothetical protein